MERWSLRYQPLHAVISLPSKRGKMKKEKETFSRAVQKHLHIFYWPVFNHIIKINPITDKENGATVIGLYQLLITPEPQDSVILLEPQ